MKTNAIKLLSFLLILYFVLPAQLYASSRKPTIIMLPVGKNQEQDQIQMIQKIRHKLMKQFQILSLDSVKQLQKTSSASSKDPKLSEALHLMNDSMDTYNTFQSNSDKTILAMDAVTEYITDQVMPSAQASELRVSALMTKAWLLFQKHKKTASEEALRELLILAPKSNLQISFYPQSFRRFFLKTKKEIHKGDSLVKIRSVPSGVDVFLNHIFVGTTPLELNLPKNKYIVGFASPGRKTVTKKLNLTKSSHKSIKASLPWQGKSGSKMAHKTMNWGKLKQSKKMIYAAQISNTAQADKSVFFNFVRHKNGVIPEATIYDARYSQMMKTIAYPKPITNLAQNQVASYFAKKLTPYLNGSSVSYWSKKIDKDIIVDHRIANKGKKPLYKKPIFWAVAIGLMAIGTTTAVLLSQGGSSDTKTGGVTVNFDGI